MCLRRAPKDWYERLPEEPVEHMWGDGWEHWDELHEAIAWILGKMHDAGICMSGKEKYGTYREDFVCFWDRNGKWGRILVPFKKVRYNMIMQRAFAMHPDIVYELCCDIDMYELVKPGIFGRVDGKKVHSKYWRTI